MLVKIKIATETLSEILM